MWQVVVSVDGIKRSHPIRNLQNAFVFAKEIAAAYQAVAVIKKGGETVIAFDKDGHQVAIG